MLRTSAFFCYRCLSNFSESSGVTDPATTAADAPVNQLIPWLPDKDQQMHGIPFAEVILHATGKHVFARGFEK
jgi:hypothetical protein